jgi:hypothetical protein
MQTLNFKNKKKTKYRKVQIDKNIYGIIRQKEKINLVVETEKINDICK